MLKDLTGALKFIVHACKQFCYILVSYKFVSKAGSCITQDDYCVIVCGVKMMRYLYSCNFQLHCAQALSIVGWKGAETLLKLTMEN